MTRGGVYLLAGPTASGKSAIAAQLAREMGARILSADSMLVYRGMDIGTAKPPREEIDRRQSGWRTHFSDERSCRHVCF